MFLIHDKELRISVWKLIARFENKIKSRIYYHGVVGEGELHFILSLWQQQKMEVNSSFLSRLSFTLQHCKFLLVNILATLGFHIYHPTRPNHSTSHRLQRPEGGALSYFTLYSTKGLHCTGIFDLRKNTSNENELTRSNRALIRTCYKIHIGDRSTVRIANRPVYSSQWDTNVKVPLVIEGNSAMNNQNRCLSAFSVLL